MSITKKDLSRMLRAAAFSGLLGAAGLAVTAGPVHAQDSSDPPSDPSEPSDPGGTTGGTTTGGTTTGGTTDGTTTDGTDFGGDLGGSMADTGSDSSLLLLGGLGAGAGAVVLRRVIRRA